MDCNKEEAEKCQRIARRFLAEGDLEKALRFLQKSGKLYPSSAVEELIAETEARLQEGNKSPPEQKAHDRHQQTPTGKSSHRSSTSHGTPNKEDESGSAAESGGNYTSEQKALVDKMLACKDYYSMLSLSKGCSDADIKKAYKKLALQLHPDKNQAPKAEDAFKAISQAFACLSDPDKRRSYDQFGVDPDNRQPTSGPGGGMRFRRAGTGPQFVFDEDDITPEEILNMFFFGVPPQGGRGRGGRANVYTYQRGFGGPQPQPRTQHRAQPQQQNRRQEGNFFSGILQLLPILLMLLLLMFSTFFRDEPLYKLEPTGSYTVPRETKHAFKYYVREDFNTAYRHKVEEEVDSRWVQYLRESCYAQMQEKRRLVNKARWAVGDQKIELMEQANSVELTACELLEERGYNVPGYTR